MWRRLLAAVAILLCVVVVAAFAIVPGQVDRASARWPSIAADSASFQLGSGQEQLGQFLTD
jgi:hypothetical protein